MEVNDTSMISVKFRIPPKSSCHILVVSTCLCFPVSFSQAYRCKHFPCLRNSRECFLEHQLIHFKSSSFTLLECLHCHESFGICLLQFPNKHSLSLICHFHIIVSHSLRVLPLTRCGTIACANASRPLLTRNVTRIAPLCFQRSRDCSLVLR